MRGIELIRLGQWTDALEYYAKMVHSQRCKDSKENLCGQDEMEYMRRCVEQEEIVYDQAEMDYLREHLETRYDEVDGRVMALISANCIEKTTEWNDVCLKTIPNWVLHRFGIAWRWKIASMFYPDAGYGFIDDFLDSVDVKIAWMHGYITTNDMSKFAHCNGNASVWRERICSDHGECSAHDPGDSVKSECPALLASLLRRWARRRGKLQYAPNEFPMKRLSWRGPIGVEARDNANS